MSKNYLNIADYIDYYTYLCKPSLDLNDDYTDHDYISAANYECFDITSLGIITSAIFLSIEAAMLL